MHVIDGQAGLIICASLIFYSLTIDNILNIIVLLILAGVSIQMLTGDNGILNRATEAKENTDSAQIKERIQLAYHSALARGQGGYTKEILEDELEKEFSTDYSVDDLDNNNWILTAKGQSVTIPAGKEDTSKVTIKVGTTNLKEVANLSTLYGQTTDYTSVSNVQWQLFYDDTDYIFLIAEDYVPNSMLGEELWRWNDNRNYSAFFSDYYTNSKMTGTIVDDEPWCKGVESEIIKNNILTNKYLKWVNSSLVSVKDYNNMKAVAYMMDTSKWSYFAGNAEGAFAIAGPTLEMFVLSYNSKHDIKLGTYEEDTNSMTAYGYQVKIGDGTWSYGCHGLDTTSSNMWVKTSRQRADGCWIVAPSSYGKDFVSHISYNGDLNTYGWITSGARGFRPLISIPKSSLK